MAAFSSSSSSPFLLDSSVHHFHLSNSSTTISNKNIMCGLLEDPNNDNLCSQFYQPHQTLHQHTTKLNNVNNEGSVLISNSTTMDSSSIVTNQKRKYMEPTFPNSAQSKRGVLRGKKQKKMKDSEEKKNKSKEKKKGAEEEEAPRGYIHVRARRGQATDSHSLAERVRREKISERMKLLQALVPGCDKLTGKALMLDEIINYVQSLQNQVEFLSMKLASVNPMFSDFGMDLESVMVTPDENLSNLPQEYSPTTANNSILFQEDQFANVFPQENRQVLWEVDEQRQRNIINRSGFNNMFSFN